MRRLAPGRLLPALLVLAVVGCAGEIPVSRDLAAYRAQRGELRRGSATRDGRRGRYVVERVRLESSTGLVATGVLYRPAADSGCFAAALLQDGREENSGVIGRLPPDFGDIVVLSLDYPAELPYAVRLRDVLRRSRDLERAARRIPPILSLGAAYLARRPDVDSTRIALAATSFAVPFATIAAAMDSRFRNVVLIYGAGDLARVLAANLPGVPAPLRRPVAALAVRPFASFAPERFVGRIAPRPVVMVNGIDDPQMPVGSVQRLYAAARPPRSLIWLRTGHLMPTDSALIRTLMDTAFARLPVLRGTSATPACAHRAGGMPAR